MDTKNIKFTFFGTDEFAVMVLDELERSGFMPSSIIAGEDKPVGRKMIVTPPPVKIWAAKHNIKIFQPKTLRESKETGITENIKEFSGSSDLFIVAFYNKIIPQEILDIPISGTLNIHPSLLPKLRGPSPTKSAILEENETGVTIMLIDAEMDHGPILAQEKIEIPEWPPYNSDLQPQLVEVGAKLLVKTIPDWMEGKIKPKEQDHGKATICKKITKEDGLLDLSESAEKNLRKIRAFDDWPTTYFFIEKNNTKIRIIVTKARIENGELIIEQVIPEGKKEMPYSDFKRGLKLL